MEQKAKRILLSLLLILLLGVFFLFSQTDDKLHLYFCDVGQGDAIYIRFPNKQDMLIDGGYTKQKVIDCLSENMPFYDREIDLVILTHPEADHLNGLISVIERYKVKYFVSSPAGNKSQGYQELLSLIKDKEIKVKNLYSGDSINFDSVFLKVVWPEKDWVLSSLNCYQAENCSQLASTNNSVLGIYTENTNLNDFSLITFLTYDNFDVFLTADMDQRIERQMLDLGTIKTKDNILEILKVPHHGSKNSLTESFLDKYTPILSIISVGKNFYGHPHQETIDKLLGKGSEIKRTDLEGTIEIVADGKKWWVNEKNMVE